MAATVEMLQVFLGADLSHETAAMEAALAAANDIVSQLRPDLTTSEPWAPRADQAATIEAARILGRRSSVQGVAAFADVGVTLLPRLDPEVRSLLQLGEYQSSVVA